MTSETLVTALWLWLLWLWIADICWGKGEDNIGHIAWGICLTYWFVKLRLMVRMSLKVFWDTEEKRKDNNE